MYHPRMRQMTLPSFVRGPLAGLGYALLWLLLWPTAQPYWMLPFGVISPFRSDLKWMSSRG